jgi:hypothetical protein
VAPRPGTVSYRHSTEKQQDDKGRPHVFFAVYLLALRPLVRPNALYHYFRGPYHLFVSQAGSFTPIQAGSNERMAHTYTIVSSHTLLLPTTWAAGCYFPTPCVRTYMAEPYLSGLPAHPHTLSPPSALLRAVPSWSKLRQHKACLAPHPALATSPRLPCLKIWPYSHVLLGLACLHHETCLLCIRAPPSPLSNRTTLSTSSAALLWSL